MGKRRRGNGRNVGSVQDQPAVPAASADTVMNQEPPRAARRRFVLPSFFQRWIPAELSAAPSRRVLVTTLSVLVVALLVVVGVGARYLLFGTAGADALPPLVLPGQQAEPRFLFAINGVTRPLGVAVSPAGDRIYVTESDGDRQLKIFDRDGNLLKAVAPPDTQPAGRSPIYVAVSNTGEVYVTDRTRGTVDKYSRDGDYEGVLDPPAEIGKLWAPLAVATTPTGEIALTDVTKDHHRVLIIGSDGKLRLNFGQEGTDVGQFSYPNAIAFDREGNIYVSDSNNGRVEVFDATGHYLWTLGRSSSGAIGLPRGLAIDGDDHLYVVDAINHNVLVYQLRQQGVQQLFTLGSNGQGNGEFSFPNGLTIDRTGRIYITDRENQRVQVWTK